MTHLLQEAVIALAISHRLLFKSQMSWHFEARGAIFIPVSGKDVQDHILAHRPHPQGLRTGLADCIKTIGGYCTQDGDKLTIPVSKSSQSISDLLQGIR
jgi:hypothetical protein